MADVLAGERLFIAAPISDKAREELKRRLPDILPGRPVPPDKWHFTLRFLGATPVDQRDRLIDELRKVRFSVGFFAELGGLGAFPSPAHAHVLWVGLKSGAEFLGQLAKEVEDAVKAAGFQAETRPFRSHLTLSRLDRVMDIRRLIDIVPVTKVTVHISEVVLFRSHLGRSGARHEPIAAFP
jgi:2'-5' RNA ligase